MKNIPAHDRRRLADMAGVDEQYLYQCLTGRRAIKPEEAVRIEAATLQELRRWDLRPQNWHEIWPELIGIEGAPPIGGDVHAEAAASGAAAEPAAAASQGG